MTDVLTTEADTGAVVNRKPAQPDVNGVDAELVAQLVERARTAVGDTRGRISQTKDFTTPGETVIVVVRRDA